MKKTSVAVSTTTAAALFATVAVLAGCGAMPGSSSSSSSSSSPAPAPAPAPAPSPKSRAGMNERGDVIDPRKVEAGSGKTVKGLNDYEGEITGNPVPGTKFTQLQIGMPMKQVTDICGQPTDQGAYITGKAFIPFYYGGDRYRHELLYKGYGRLIFAGGSMGDISGRHLIWIIHSANESGYR